MTLIDLIVKRMGSRMPNKDEIHLPHFTKREVYNTYTKPFTVLYPHDDFVSECYFLAVWKKEHINVKVSMVSEVTKCATRERLRAEMKEATESDV